MIRIETLIQLKAFARQDALWLALMWTASFACITLLNAGLIGDILALATPFLVGKRLCSFRDNALDGNISFRRAFAYSAYTFLYASLVFALVQFAYFQFVDHGAFANNLTTTMRILEPMYEQNGIGKEQVNNYISILGMITPIQWAFMFMMQNLFIGAVLSLPIAAICKRRNK